MSKKTKWFRVAVEGATATDGRTIEKKWLTDIAATYNRATYGARVNMEHIRGFSPQGPFNAYGDVLAVKTEEVTLSIGGKDEKRLALFAQVEALDELVRITAAGQKIYTSIEVAPNFANTGKAGLVGLAVTDGPASLGTDILQFSAKAGDAAASAIKASLDRRKADQANHFSAAEETAIAYEDDAGGSGATALESFAALVAKFLKGDPATPPEPKVEPPPAGDDVKALSANFTKVLEGLAKSIDANRVTDQAAFAALRTEFSDLKAKLDSTEQRSAPRPASTGATDVELTDC